MNNLPGILVLSDRLRYKRIVYIKYLFMGILIIVNIIYSALSYRVIYNQSISTGLISSSTLFYQEHGKIYLIISLHDRALKKIDFQGNIYWTINMDNIVKSNILNYYVDENDTYPDIIAVTTSGTVYRISSDGEILAYRELGEPVSASPSSVDINNDSLAEIVIPTETGKIYILNTQLSIISSLSLNQKIIATPLVIGESDIDYHLNTVYLADFSGKIFKIFFSEQSSGIIYDIIYMVESPVSTILPLYLTASNGFYISAFAQDGYIYTIDSNGTPKWNLKTELPVSLSGISFREGDIDVLVVADDSHYIYKIDAITGNLIEKYDADSSVYLSEYVIKDKNDNFLIFYADNSGKVVILNQRLELLSQYSLSIPVSSQPIVYDLNGDGYIDIAVPSLDSKLYFFTTDIELDSIELREKKSTFIPQRLLKYIISADILELDTDIHKISPQENREIHGNTTDSDRLDGGRDNTDISQPSLDDNMTDGGGVVVETADKTGVKDIDAAENIVKDSSEMPEYINWVFVPEDIGTMSGEIYVTYPLPVDIDDDGVLEIIFSLNNLIYIVDADGKEKNKIIKKERILSPISASDIFDNGIIYFIYSIYNTGIVCTDVFGKDKWIYATKEDITAPLLISDIDNDGNKEIIAATKDGNILVLNNMGDLLWRYYAGEKLRTVPEIYDINRDDKKEIIVSGSDKNVHVLSNDGEELFIYPALSKMRSPVVIDLPGSQLTEIVVHTYSKKLISFMDKSGDHWVYHTDSLPFCEPQVLRVEGKSMVSVCGDGEIHIIDAAGVPVAKISIDNGISDRFLVFPDFDTDDIPEIGFIDNKNILFFYDIHGNVLKKINIVSDYICRFPIVFRDAVSEKINVAVICYNSSYVGLYNIDTGSKGTISSFFKVYLRLGVELSLSEPSDAAGIQLYPGDISEHRRMVTEKPRDEQKKDISVSEEIDEIASPTIAAVTPEVDRNKTGYHETQDLINKTGEKIMHKNMTSDNQTKIRAVLAKNGFSCVYNSNCESGNCKNGICCDMGKICCRDDADCKASMVCDKDKYYCVETSLPQISYIIVFLILTVFIIIYMMKIYKNKKSATTKSRFTYYNTAYHDYYAYNTYSKWQVKQKWR